MKFSDDLKTTSFDYYKNIPGRSFIYLCIELSGEEGGLMYILSIVGEKVGLTDEITLRSINTVLVKGVL